VEAQDQEPPDKKAARRYPTARQCQFARLVATGTSQAEAYRTIYNPKCKNQRAAEKGCRMAVLPNVAREIERIRAKAEAKDLLTLNDRFRILSKIAQDPDVSATAQVAAVMGYSKLSGDGSPERQEISGPGGGPIPVADQTAPTPAARLSVRERVELFKRRREGIGMPALSGSN
jgi:hypothetical protein